MRKTSIIETLIAPPKGNDTYLPITMSTLEWCANTARPTHMGLSHWVATNFDINLTTAREFIQVIKRIGLITAFQGNNIRLTDLGRRITLSDPTQQKHLLVQQLMKRCTVITQLLEIFSEFPRSLQLDETIDALHHCLPTPLPADQVEFRLIWLSSLGCLKRVQHQTYQITDFGTAIFSEYSSRQETLTLSSLNDAPPESVVEIIQQPELPLVDTLTHELMESANDSGSPQRLELALADAFRFLGFKVENLGRSGESDFLIHASIGSKSYKVVGDAKSRHKGKVAVIDYYALKQHLLKEKAQYTLVVADTFAEGRLPQQAEANGVVLLTISVLITWLRFHSISPLNLEAYRLLFTTPGLRSEFPFQLKQAAEQRLSAAQLLGDLIETIQEAYHHGLNHPLSATQLLPMLVMRQKALLYSDQQIAQALNLLSYPAISGIVGDNASGVDLLVNRTMLAQILHSLAHQIENWEEREWFTS